MNLLDLPDEILELIVQPDAKLLSVVCRRLRTVSLQFIFNYLSFSKPTVWNARRLIEMIHMASEHDDFLDGIPKTNNPLKYSSINAIKKNVVQVSVLGSMGAIPNALLEDEPPVRKVHLANLLKFTYFIRDDPITRILFQDDYDWSKYFQSLKKRATDAFCGMKMPLKFLQDPENIQYTLPFIMKIEAIFASLVATLLHNLENIINLDMENVMEAFPILEGASATNTLKTVTLDSCHFQPVSGITLTTSPPTAFAAYYPSLTSIDIEFDSSVYSPSVATIQFLLSKATSCRFFNLKVNDEYKQPFIYPSHINMPVVEDFTMWDFVTDHPIIFPKDFTAPKMTQFSGSWRLFDKLCTSYYPQITDLYLNQPASLTTLCFILRLCESLEDCTVNLAVEWNGLEQEHLPVLMHSVSKTIQAFECCVEETEEFTAEWDSKQNLDWVGEFDFPNLKSLSFEDFYREKPETWEAHELLQVCEKLLIHFPQLDRYCHRKIKDDGSCDVWGIPKAW